MHLKHLVAVLIPPSGSGMEGIDSLTDKVGVLEVERVGYMSHS